ncbi:MAG: hypothetical protein M1814_004184 [Vezdaea aestivalis]|nr:MAG: hypothetical protein M1814_004184 [Vezdaea aestivalis]
MRKTVVLCFIHGFKGDDNTFGGFPEHLRLMVSKALPKVDFKTIIYPKFETRGDLGECVERFRDWLQNHVIDLEVAAGNPAPTVDASVRTILIGHSMGGMVAADTFLNIASEQLVSSSDSQNLNQQSSFLFPDIQGVLAFDTPYLGIAPGVVAHAAEKHYNTASSTMTQLSGLAGSLWGAAAAAEPGRGNTGTRPLASLPEAPNGAPLSPGLEKGSSDKQGKPAAVESDKDAAAAPVWQRWGKMAMFAGAAGAVAAGGAAAYLKRDDISQGWGWMGSHLEFVGCLVKGEDLKKRMDKIAEVCEDRSVGFANLFTELGERTKTGMVGGVTGKQRTFCNLPKSASKDAWQSQINVKAEDEVTAHMSMFFPGENPAYFDLASNAATLISEWTKNGWYESSDGIEDVEMIGDVES